MKKILFIVLTLSIFCLPAISHGEETQGMLPGTDIAYTEFSVSKSGVAVRFINTYYVDTKFSAKVVFYDQGGNTLGHSIFALRTLPAEGWVDLANNHISGDWKKCKRAARVEWQTLTHEILYDS